MILEAIIVKLEKVVVIAEGEKRRKEYIVVVIFLANVLGNKNNKIIANKLSLIFDLI